MTRSRSRDVLDLGPGLRLDADYIGSSTLALLGKKGAGKSFTTRVMAEEFWRAEVPFVLFDPMGTNWGLRSSADGQSEGIPIPIFGGKHADAPLERTAGRVMAELAVDGVSSILDISELGSHGAEREFVYDFFEYLYRHNEDLIHILLDESDLYAPQKPGSDTGRVSPAKLLGLIDNIVRRGRNKAIAITLMTQRSAVLNKDVLTQVDGIVVLRTLGPPDQRAIRDWFVDHADPENVREIMASLPHLANGEAWVWIPDLHVFTRSQIRMAHTFDSSPTRGRKQRIEKPKGYADIDLAGISAKIAQTVEKVKADDPRELRRRVAALERELDKKSHSVAPERIEVPVLANGVVDRLEGVASAVADAAALLGKTSSEIRDELRRVAAGPGPAPVPDGSVDWKVVPQIDARKPRREPAPHANVRAPAGDGVRLRKGEREMLTVIAQRHPTPLTRSQLGTLSGFPARGNTFGTYLGTLKRAGLITEHNGEVQATDAGLDHLGEIPPAGRTTDELLAMWRRVLRAGERTMLDVLVERYPRAVTRGELGDLAGFPASGNTFGTYLGTLRRNGLAEVDGGVVRASDALFPTRTHA